MFKTTIQTNYDVVVIGSGIAGTTTALVMARQGLQVLVVERKSHPRFAIGESTVPATSGLFCSLARRYRIPELEKVSHYLGLKELGCTAFPKQMFWFGLHEEGKQMDVGSEFSFETLLLPFGPDVHMMRSDVDQYLVSSLARYGVHYTDHTEVVEFSTTPDAAQLRLHRDGRDHSVRAGLVLDASGHASLLAKQYQLRNEAPQLKTNTRALFTHAAGIPPLDSVLPLPNPNMRFLRSAGTGHHCFDGGWVWTIPFDNETTSVGFMLDREKHPLNNHVSPEQEVKQVLSRFPSMHAHLGNMRPLQPWVRTDRVQFTSKTVVGERFLLTPHAAAFVDPLFSSGILLTLAFITRLAPIARQLVEDPASVKRQVQALDDAFQKEIRQVDLLVSGLVQGFRDRDVAKQYWRNWVYASYSQLGAIIALDGQLGEDPWLYGAGMASFVDELEDVHSQLNDSSIAALRRRLETHADRWQNRMGSPVLRFDGLSGSNTSEPFSAYGDPKKLALNLFRFVKSHEKLGTTRTLWNATKWQLRALSRLNEQRREYNGPNGELFKKPYDRILQNEESRNFDYRNAIRMD